MSDVTGKRSVDSNGIHTGIYCYGFSGGGIRTRLLTPVLRIRTSLNSTTVSGVITPAGSAQALGHAPRIAIPTYTWTLPVGDIDPGYRLDLSETERSLPVRSPFWFYIPTERIVSQHGTNKPKAATSYESARFIGDTSGNTTQASMHDNVIINL